MIGPAFLAGWAAGILSGMGVGGGTLLLVWLTVVAGVSPAEAALYNLLYFLCCAPPALVGHLRHGRVDARAVFWSLCGGLPACLAAWRLAACAGTQWLRYGFGGLLILVGLRELTAGRHLRRDLPPRT